MYYNFQRWYDPSTGRFITVDPIKGHRSDPQTLNPYIYVTDTPTTLTDPSGMSNDYGECTWTSGWGSCLESAIGAVGSWYRSLSPGEQEAVGIGTFAAVTYATGGTDLLLAGAAGFGFGFSANVFYTEATGGTPTLSGALTWGNVAFGLALGAYGAYSIGTNLLSSEEVLATEASADELVDTSAFWRTTERGGYDFERTQVHHLLPRQFQSFFESERVGLSIDDYTVELDRGVHAVLHGRGGSYFESWNGFWEGFIANNKFSDSSDTLEFLRMMLVDFGF